MDFEEIDKRNGRIGRCLRNFMEILSKKLKNKEICLRFTRFVL